MVSRLVLGCGTVGQRVVERLPEREERVLVVDDDPTVVEALRDENVPAEAGDPTDPGVLDGIEAPTTVIVAGDRTDRNRVALANARERFPSAAIVAYTGGNATDRDRRQIERLADRVVDPGAAIAGDVVERAASRSAENGLLLRRQLAGIDGRLAVVTHDNPDPDAIASAVALCDLAAAVGVEADACYYGEISHQENRAMVNLLDLDLRNLGPDESLEAYAGFALVDHSRPGVNDQLPEELHVDVVIDHHPPRGPVPGEFVDLRETAGATSTVLTEYVDRFGVEVDRRTATALLYGIRIDTNDFSREASEMDFRSAATLLPHVDAGVLARIENPSVEGETFDTIARAIKNRTRQGSVVVASAGRIASRDALPQAAEELLTMEGVDTTLVFGIIGEMAFVSARSRGTGLDLGESLRDAFDPIGSAGGHADMAGAQLEIGILGEVDDEQADSIVGVVEEVITKRFFEAVGAGPGASVGAYSRTSEWLFAPGDEREGVDAGPGEAEETNGTADVGGENARKSDREP